MRLLYFCPNSRGGLADYAREQAKALALGGVQVELVTTDAFPRDGQENYRIVTLFEERVAKGRLKTKLRWAASLLRNMAALDAYITRERFDHVLLASYVEFLAPLWSRRFRAAKDRGVTFGAIIHDPVRNFVIGPGWWHRWSIACGYSFLREAFLHEEMELDTGRPMPLLRKTIIPHGPYQLPKPSESRRDVRRRLGVPEAAPLFLAFGYIRDGKNLDLVLEALSSVPSAYVLVAGEVQSSSQRPLKFYQDVAVRWGTAERCRWINRYISPQEIANLFEASDYCVVTYNGAFRSASGVMNTAASYGRPVLASSGPGPLKSVVERYHLGTWVEPDKVGAVAVGMQYLLDTPIGANWEGYRADNSWRRNAQLVREALFDA